MLYRISYNVPGRTARCKASLDPYGKQVLWMECKNHRQASLFLGSIILPEDPRPIFGITTIADYAVGATPKANYKREAIKIREIYGDPPRW